MAEQPVRRHFIFSGRVQGVGFRYRALYAARLLGLTGWVKNNPDGTVELTAQGQPQDIAQLLPKMTASDWIWIQDTKAWTEPVDPTERDFQILD